MARLQIDLCPLTTRNTKHETTNLRIRTPDRFLTSFRNDKEPYWCQFVKLVSTAYWLFLIKPSLFSIVFSLLGLDSWFLAPHWTRFSIHFLSLFLQKPPKNTRTDILNKNLKPETPNPKLLTSDFGLPQRFLDCPFDSFRLRSMANAQGDSSKWHLNSRLRTSKIYTPKKSVRSNGASVRSCTELFPKIGTLYLSS